MQKGILYSLVNWLIESLKYLNFVELFKFLLVKIYSKDRITALRFAVDIFIILKWIFIALLWLWNVKNSFVNLIVWYLIATNVYTYFYYHAWTKDIAKAQFDLDRIKRRFMNLILSIGFNIICFAYFFAQPFGHNFKWEKGFSTLQDAVSVSIANSLTSSYYSVQAITEIGHTLLFIETGVSFVFLTIILSNSIPQIKTD